MKKLFTTWSRVTLVAGSASVLLAPTTAQCTLDVEPIGIPGVSAPFNQPWARSFAEWDPDGGGPLGSRLVVCGNFTEAGTVFADDVATFDPVTGDWEALSGLPQTTTEVVFVDAAGNLLAGGWYGLRRWDGAAWVTDVPMNGHVRALAEDAAGNLLIAGSLQTVAGVGVSNIASWDGAVATPVGAVAPAPFNDFISDIAVRPNGEILVSGIFTNAGGGVANGAAWFDGVAWNAFPFQPNPITSATAVETLPNGDVAIALRRNVQRRVETWDGTQLTFIGAADDTVWQLETDAAGDLLATGDFTSIGGVSASRVARFDGASWVDAGTGWDGDGARVVLALQSGDVFATRFTRIQRLVGGAWIPIELGLAPLGPNNGVRALLTRANGNLVAGGLISSAGLQFVGGVAELDGDDWLPLAGGVTGTVNALAELPGGDLVAAGRFQSTEAGILLDNISRFDGTAWGPVGQGLGGTFEEVRALEVLTNGDLVAGGRFTVIGGAAASHLATFDGTAWTTLAGGVTSSTGHPNASVDAIAQLANGDLVVAGFFDSAGGVPAPGIARLSGSTWSPLGNASISGSITTLLALPNGDLIAGGPFVIGGNIQNVARFDGTSWSAVGNPLLFPVMALDTLFNGDIVAGGDNGDLSRLTAGTWQPLVTGTSTGSIDAFTELPNGDVIAGGTITELGGRVTGLLARLDPSCVPSVTVLGDGCAGQTLTAVTEPFVGTSLVTRGANLPRSGFAWSVYSLGSGFGGAIPLGAFFPEGQDSCFGFVPPDFSLIIPLDPNGNPIDSTLSIPNSVALAGTLISTQMIVFETDATGTVLAVTSTDALLAEIGLN